MGYMLNLNQTEDLKTEERWEGMGGGDDDVQYGRWNWCSVT